MCELKRQTINIEQEKMKPENSMLRTCSKGHKYHKSSECPICPICEKEKKPKDGFLSFLAAPARRALEKKGITKLENLTKYSEKEILKLHGFGESSLPILRNLLSEKKLSFKE
jgi:predicted RecB family nuclease